MIQSSNNLQVVSESLMILMYDNKFRRYELQLCN